MHIPIKPFEVPQVDVLERDAETRSLRRVFAVAALVDLALFALLLAWIQVA